MDADTDVPPWLTYKKIFFFVCETCNFKCKHCFTSKGSRMLSSEDIELFLREFVELVDYKPDVINIAGSGNPILNKDLPNILKIANRFSEKTVTLNVRGGIPDSVFKSIIENDVSILYSLDWYGRMNDIHCGVNGLWDMQVKVIKQILPYLKNGAKTKYKGFFVVRQTIMRDNFGDCMLWIDYISDLRKKGYRIKWEGMPYVVYSTNDKHKAPSPKQLSLLIQRALEDRKGGIRVVHPCFNFLHPIYRDNHPILSGKPLEGGTQRICEAGRQFGRICMKEDKGLYTCPFDFEPVGYYGKQSLLELLELVFNRSDNTPQVSKCKSCIRYDICGGGCIVERRKIKSVVCPIPYMEGGANQI